MRLRLFKETFYYAEQTFNLPDGFTGFIYHAKGDDCGIGVAGQTFELSGTAKQCTVRDMSFLKAGALAVTMGGAQFCVHHLTASGRVAQIKYKGKRWPLQLCRNIVPEVRLPVSDVLSRRPAALRRRLQQPKAHHAALPRLP